MIPNNVSEEDGDRLFAEGKYAEALIHYQKAPRYYNGRKRIARCIEKAELCQAKLAE